MSKARNIADIGSHDVIETDSDGVTVIGDLTIPDKIVHTGDTNTAIRFPAADTVTVETAGAERVRVDSSGNVGVGTSNPQKALNVVADSSSTTIGGSTAVIQVGNSNGSTLNLTAGIELFGSGPPSSGLGNRSAGIYGLYESFNASGNAGALVLATNPAGTTSVAERVRVNSSGNVGIGTTAPDCALTIGNNPGTGNLVLHITRPGISDNILVYAADVYSPSAAAATFKIGSQSSTSRSINATGTVNASGTDYAEYMTKAGDFTVAKGDVIGIDENGQLTNVFANSVTFVVKSTNPSIVGGDVWGTVDAIGCEQPKNLPDDASDDEKASYQNELAVFEAALEAARQKVDRIAFAGQVPVNVYGASPGQYIVPANDGGNIKGVSKNEGDMTLADYMKAVGKVISIEADGRARIIVKVA